jgi:hypothetical protein
MTRVLLGRDKYVSGANGVSEEDGAKAVSILINFDMVLVLELQQYTQPLLQQMLGWWAASDLSEHVGRKRVNPSSPLSR